MAVEEVITVPITILSELLTITRWLQALGVVIIIWISIQVANWLINKKRLKELYKIKEDMKRIENKIDNLKK